MDHVVDSAVLVRRMVVQELYAVLDKQLQAGVLPVLVRLDHHGHAQVRRQDLNQKPSPLLVTHRLPLALTELAVVKVPL